MIHLAGNNVYLGTRVIQRCLLCGMMLCDSLGVSVAEGSGGFVTFSIGDWVEVEGDNPRRFVVVGKTDHPTIAPADVPNGCCTEAE